MKKLLLLSALAIGSFAANADYTEYFSVSYEGVEYPSGSTIQCHSNIAELAGTLRYEADIDVTSKLEFSIPLLADLVNAPGDNNGTPSLCFATTGEEFIGGQWVTFPDYNCFPSLPNICTLYPEILPQSEKPSNFMWQAEALGVDKDATCTVVLKFCPCEGDVDNYEPIEDALYEMTIVFSPEEAGIDSLNTDADQAPVYYNLQGVRVTEPANGIYIVKRGNKTTKEIVKN